MQSYKYPSAFMITNKDRLSILIETQFICRQKLEESQFLLQGPAIIVWASLHFAMSFLSFAFKYKIQNEEKIYLKQKQSFEK